MDSHHDFGIAGSWQAVYGDDTWSQPNDWTVGMLGGTSYDKVVAVVDSDYVQGAAFLMRTALLNRIGYLDTAYGTFYEETDLCRRCRLLGYRVGLLLESRVQHQGGGHWRKAVAANRWRDRLYLRNQLLYKLSEPDTPNWPLAKIREVVTGQIRSVRAGKEDLVLPPHQYFTVLISFVARLKYLRHLRLRNRLIREKTDIPEPYLCVGPSRRDAYPVK